MKVAFTGTMDAHQCEVSFAADGGDHVGTATLKGGGNAYTLLLDRRGNGQVEAIPVATVGAGFAKVREALG